MVELSSFLAGAGLGLSLLIAIGAQNAFVLRHGLMRHHVGVVVTLCAVSDVALISAGILGVGKVVAEHPSFLTVAHIGGAAFVFAYGVFALRRAFRPSAMKNEPDVKASLATVALAAAGITWLNPYVYLDTMILIGSVASTHDAKVSFGIGACSASVLWFVSLGYASRFLRPLFAKPSSWRVLDGVIAATMFVIGTSLIAGNA